MAMDAGSVEVTDDIRDDPLNTISHSKLRQHVKNLYLNYFEEEGLVTEFELWTATLVAKKYTNHYIPPVTSPTPGEIEEKKRKRRRRRNSRVEPSTNRALPASQRQPTRDPHGDEDRRRAEERRKIRPNLHPQWTDFDSENDEEEYLVGKAEWKRAVAKLRVQESKMFLREPTGLLVTLATCCVASMTQGWDQVANGNLGWPDAFGVVIDGAGIGPGIWKFGAANAITWFVAAISGVLFLDQLCHRVDSLGRRGAVFIAAIFSFSAMIGASQARSWSEYMVARAFLGVGIGAKAACVPIWESEILPKAKRGRLLVLWQVFVAVGIFAGSIATWIFRKNWRLQVITGAIPAFALLFLVLVSCESPRWLIMHEKYDEAFANLLRLRGQRTLALEELCFLHFQLRAERAGVTGEHLDYDYKWTYLHWSDRLGELHHGRIRRAILASCVVMLSQQLSGINILAFLATIFFSAANLQPQPDSGHEIEIQKNEYDSLKLTIGFGLVNAVFSSLAFFLIERKKDERGLRSPYPTTSETETPHMTRNHVPGYFRGRRNLLLWSLGSGAVMLFILAFLLGLSPENKFKKGAVIAFVILFTLCHGPGTGAVPFVYSAEVFPTEWREMGMSLAVCVNFLGAGILALCVPRMLQWGAKKTFGLFSGLSVLGFLLVWVFVPSTGPSMTLEDMSKKFTERTRDYARRKLFKLGRKYPRNHVEEGNMQSQIPAPMVGRIALQQINGPLPDPSIAPAYQHAGPMGVLNPIEDADEMRRDGNIWRNQ